MTFNPFSAVTSKIFGATALTLVMVVGLQGCRIDRIEGERDRAIARAKDEAAAHAGTVANYRAAALQFALSMTANLGRVQAEQQRISDETLASYDARLADARRRLREAGARTDPGRAGATAMPGAGDAAGGAAEAPDDILSADERLIAAEQAIQLDELINWVERQGVVATSPAAASTD
jgi:hypothetical protein